MSRLSRSGGVPPWDVALRSLGLRRTDDGVAYRKDGACFRVRSGWGTFESNAGPRRSDPLRGQLGQAGLWKPVTDARRRIARKVFELPPTLMVRAGSDAGRFEELADWALGTARGSACESWSPPDQEEVERWLPDHALTLQVGAIARQGTMSLDEHRLAFGFPIVSKVPRGLPGASGKWLRELLTDAQNRWRLVRIGMTGDSEAWAEFDLSGAPHDALEELVHVGLDALRHVVSLLVEPADFLVNGADGCRAVQMDPNGPGPKRR